MFNFSQKPGIVGLSTAESGFHLLEEEDGADLGLCQMEDQAAPPTLKQLDCLKAVLRKRPTNLMTPIISKATNLLCSLFPPVYLPPPSSPRLTPLSQTC